MHRPHLQPSVRRRLCRATFCLGCLLPTTALLGWTVSRKLPGHVEQCEQRLSDLLGLDAHVERVTYPQPGLRLYEGIELSDPETGQPVLRGRWLELGQTGPVWVVRPAFVEVDSDQAGGLVRLLMRRLQRELPAAEGSVRILPTRVTLRGPHDEQTYDDAECLIESTEAGDSATLRFRLAGVELNEAATVIVTRRHAAGASATRVSLDTAGAWLPVSMFAAWLDAQHVLGSDARFRGSLWIDRDARGQRGDLSGVLTDVDLETLVAARFPHVLTGRATLEIDRARIEQGRLVEAAGLLRCDEGVVGRSLIEAAVDALGCRGGNAIDRHQVNLRYRRLTMRFALDAEGLQLAGMPTEAHAGVILSDERQEPLLSEPPRQRVPAVALVRALVPPNETHVPATKETSALVPWLPLPPIVPPRTGDGSPPRPTARVRLPKM